MKDKLNKKKLVNILVKGANQVEPIQAVQTTLGNRNESHSIIVQVARTFVWYINPTIYIAFSVLYFSCGWLY